MAAQLAIGLELDDREIRGLEWWANLTDEQIEEFAIHCGLSRDVEELMALMPDLRELAEEAIEDLDGNVLRDPRPDLSVDEILDDVWSRADHGAFDAMLASEEVDREMKKMGLRG
ncbi:hypothetical protein RhiJN_27462 [Ceratobasidium sp. AG-Ba]|nr:hypothetical protein RhiJN_13395 [Ceratobasidium sp. AG-Ba]QRV99443.1 hypothetical protein RhiJN_27462 [Ceratobasidium sp. AG-Ba]QRW13951.1 hypothetical protein RhiLY_12950 [Ceratobasidium sp. AG-Ba]